MPPRKNKPNNDKDISAEPKIIIDKPKGTPKPKIPKKKKDITTVDEKELITLDEITTVDENEISLTIPENINNIRKVKQISMLQHAKNKSMWVGSKKIQTTDMYCLSNDKKTFILEKVKFAPAWYKITDEIVVNAIDQWVNYPDKVNKISKL